MIECAAIEDEQKKRKRSRSECHGVRLKRSREGASSGSQQAGGAATQILQHEPKNWKLGVAGIDRQNTARNKDRASPSP
jgi:hypothetical protein